jgi:hypothetical protein
MQRVWLLNILIWPLLAAADPQSTLPFFTSDYSTQPKLMIFSSAHFEGAYYPSTIPATPNMNEEMIGSLNLLLDHSNGRNKTSGIIWSNQIDMSWGKFLDWGDTFVDVRNAYTSLKVSEAQTEVVAGRHLYDWSLVDETWHLGEWQPLFAMDPLRSEELGLTGFFVNPSWGPADLLIFFTPLFLPNTDPTVQERNGALVSDSRWFMQPSQSATLLGQTTPINYSLSVPPLTSLTAQPGSGARLRVGHRENGPWGAVAYGYKPINELQVKYNANLSSDGVSSADVVPVVAYEHLLSGDVGYSTGRYNVALSYLSDAPDTSLPVNGPYQDYWQQQPSPMSIYSVHTQLNLTKESPKPVSVLSMDYLRVFSNITYDVDSAGVPRMAIFPYRTQFSNALKVGFKTQIWWAKKKWDLGISQLRDFEQLGNVFQAQAGVHLSSRLALNAGLDSLSPDDPSAGNTDPRFINKFRANDRIYTGADYVF